MSLPGIRTTGGRDRARSRPFALAGALAALVLATGCSEADTHGVSDDGIAVFATETACALRAEGSESNIVLHVLKDSLTAKLNVEVTHTNVVLADEEVDVFLEVSGSDRARRTVHPDEVLVIEKGAQVYLTMFYPAVMLADLAATDRIGFVIDGEPANTVAPPGGFAEEAGLLADCLGRPLAAAVANAS